MNTVNGGQSAMSRKGFGASSLGIVLAMSLATSAWGQTPVTGSPVAESPLAELPEFGAVAPKIIAETPRNKGQSGITCQILPNPQGHYTAFVFDSVRGVLAVYMVDQGTGQINLKSVRQVSWDLRLEEFNTNQPSPSDLRDSQR